MRASSDPSLPPASRLCALDSLGERGERRRVLPLPEAAAVGRGGAELVGGAALRGVVVEERLRLGEERSRLEGGRRRRGVAQGRGHP